MEPIVARILPFAVLGALLGFAYLCALGWNVRLYLSCGALWIALLVHSMRLVLIGAAFTLCARQGALALLSALGGFQMMRTVVINRRSRALESKS